MTSQTPPPPPLWKPLSFLAVILVIIALVSSFLVYPNAITSSTQLFKCFSICFLLNFLIELSPNSFSKKLIASRDPENSNTQKQYWKIFAWIILFEFFIFALSCNFGLFAFTFSDQETPRHLSSMSWSIWLGLWAYFATNMTTQHFAHYELHQPNIASGLLFHFKNTYFDIAIKRALVFINLGVNLVAIHLLWISVIFIIINIIRPETLKHFYLTSFMPLMLFSFFSSLINSRNVKKRLKRSTRSNFFYLVIASSACTLAILFSALFPNYFISFANHTTTNNDVSFFLFVGLFGALTPLFTSFIVKKTTHISRKKLLLISFCAPNIFYFMAENQYFTSVTHMLANKFLFIAMVIIFSALLLRSSTTQDFISGALPLPKQRIILPNKSYMLFPAHCLIPFVFYLLASIIGPISLYGFTISAALLAALFSLIGTVSYFGKSYRQNKLYHSSSQSELLRD